MSKPAAHRFQWQEENGWQERIVGRSSEGTRQPAKGAEENPMRRFSPYRVTLRCPPPIALAAREPKMRIRSYINAQLQMRNAKAWITASDYTDFGNLNLYVSDENDSEERLRCILDIVPALIPTGTRVSAHADSEWYKLQLVGSRYARRNGSPDHVRRGYPERTGDVEPTHHKRHVR